MTKDKTVKRLKEIVKKAAYRCLPSNTTDFHLGLFVTDLIANGVTVQECGYWTSLTDCANEGVYCSVCNKKVYKADYAWCNKRNKLRSDYCPHCGAKMLPEPPKGE